MGKIVAIGGGRYDDGEIQNIIEYIASLSKNDNPKVLFLPTAGFDNIDGDEIIRELFEKCGCSFRPLLLTDKALSKRDVESAILSADIIYVGGGNVKFMMDTWNETGASEFLLRAYKKGTVMSGYSAGALCWFSIGYDDCGENGSFIFNDCLGILPYCCCPHYESGNWQTYKEEIKTQKLSGYAIENGAALIYLDGIFSTIHGNDGGDVFFFDSTKGHNEIKLDERT